MKDGPDALPRIADDLYDMAQQNLDFYAMAARRYAELAGQLKLPPMPNLRRRGQGDGAMVRAIR